MELGGCRGGEKGGASVWGGWGGVSWRGERTRLTSWVMEEIEKRGTKKSWGRERLVKISCLSSYRNQIGVSNCHSPTEREKSAKLRLICMRSFYENLWT